MISAGQGSKRKSEFGVVEKTRKRCASVVLLHSFDGLWLTNPRNVCLVLSGFIILRRKKQIGHFGVEKASQYKIPKKPSTGLSAENFMEFDSLKEILMDKVVRKATNCSRIRHRKRCRQDHHYTKRLLGPTSHFHRGQTHILLTFTRGHLAFHYYLRKSPQLIHSVLSVIKHSSLL